MFVGAVSDNFNERIEQKIFHAEIVVDSNAVERETKAYKEIPILTNIPTKEAMQIAIQANYDQVKDDVRFIVLKEKARLAMEENGGE